jgi:molybdenum cofactor cytidylyltransferase
MMTIVGILLAAGRGERFGGAKLLAPLPETGLPVGVAALRSLHAALPDVIAVVRPDDDALAALLEGEGARVIRAERADEGMGASLAAGVAASADADGWLVALADMPWIAPATHARVAAGLHDGAQIVAPHYNGRRGHPIGFAAALRAELLALGGDEGARRVLAAHGEAVTPIDVDDAGALRDVDRPGDL